MRRYFCTGATGFIGREIVRQLLKREDTQAIVCLTRGLKPNAIEHPKLQYWKGDITDCVFPEGVVVAYDDHKQILPFTDLIHGANAASFTSHKEYYETVEGTARVMKWARGMNALLLSTGGIHRNTVYAQAKRQSELIAQQHGARIARIYATVGPEIPLDGPFAVGQFVGMALKRETINCWGPSAIRTYIDVTDCARWLLTILDSDTEEPVDVAGNVQMFVGEVADLVGEIFGVPVMKHSDDRDDAYIPDLSFRNVLELDYTLTLRQSLEKIRDHYAAISAVLYPNLESLPRTGSMR